MEPILHAVREELRAIEQKLALYSDSLMGTPYVIRLFPGAYMTFDRDERAYAGRSITAGVMMYDAENAAYVVKHIREAYPALARDCGYMHIVGALHSERDELLRLLDLCEGATA